MKISYNWLQSYFEERLPAPETLAEHITFGFAEVESLDKLETGSGGDTILDVKVLPDRACYALSHRGIARELSAILNLSLAKKERKPIEESSIVADPSIRIDEPELCTKFVARRMENISVGPSPAWLRESLEAIGQRSINNIVDATNFVMFDIGRPLHAFDADKVKGTLVVRSAKKGETLVTLDNKRPELNNSELVIADDEGPVGLAGIKGGKRTEVDASTRNIILEAANWNPSYIRKTAGSTGIKTDASKRFENRISPLLGEEGIDEVTRLIASIAGSAGTGIGKRIAISFETNLEKSIPVNAEQISQKLGLALSEETILGALRRLGILCEKRGERIFARIPSERLDLTCPEDIVEEVGRIFGYDKIPAILPPKSKNNLGTPKAFYYEWKIREVLVNAGFSEVMTSSFTSTGEMAIEKPLAEDKKFARPNLRNNFERALKMNALNAPFLGATETRIFEIGKVFTKVGEYTSLAIGVSCPKKRNATLLETTLGKISDTLNVKVTGESRDGIVELNLDESLKNLPEPSTWDIVACPPQAAKFTPISPYPFIVRDIALFVSQGTAPENVQEVIKGEAGNLIVRGPELFDEFSKDGKKSLAFRMVFQSSERTLTDTEVNTVMEQIYFALKAKGWEIR